MYPIITVYIVNHNYEKFLYDSINSVLKQTFKKWELIIIDNGSNDNSREVINKYSRLENVKIIFQDNVGLTCQQSSNSILKG